MKRIIAVLVLLFLCIRAVSADGGFCVQQTGTVIVFGNGIMNTRSDAEFAEKRLEAVLKASLTADEFNKLEFQIAYNQTYGFFSDLYESLEQKMAQDNVVESFWRWLGNEEAAPQVVRDEALRIASAFDFSTQVGTEDLNNHLLLYRTKILEGKPVVVVAHSQGNSFANAAHDALYNGPNPIPANSFGIVSVANPESFVAGGGPYTTASEDLVIAAIAQTTAPGFLPPLPANITNVGSGATTSDWLGHSIIGEYLVDGSNTEPKIVSDIQTVVSNLTVPPAIATPGIITVTLTWGIQPDVDLHVGEPLGDHVYYLNKVGLSGYLDVDDTTSYGPEHYYVSCTTLEAGTYHVGVNYYFGYAPEVATVQIAAGGSVRTFTTPLAFSDGSAGNNTPVPVADITVTGDNTTGYQFAITGTGTQ